MGRTKRHRLKRTKKTAHTIYDPTVIELNRWMKNNSWYNDTKLKIASFPKTGRGLMTTVQFDPGDIIIELPFNLMISYTVLGKSKRFKRFLTCCTDKLTIHEMLCLFLLHELHLKEKSFWFSYIQSLPVYSDLLSLILCTNKEINYLDEEIQVFVIKEKSKLDENWARAQKVINSKYICDHCHKSADIFITWELYIWAHIIINTRTVYVDPEKVREASDTDLEDILDDEPSMALCPFLDMINHSSDTYTNAYLSDFNGNYFLVTNTTFKKYEQIFISYGTHSNKRLIYQYGFVVPYNINDTIDFTLKEVLLILKLNASSKQYKFLTERDLDKNLNVAYSGLSFNLGAVLYVLACETDPNWSVRVFSSDYTPEHLRVMYGKAKCLLEFRLNQYKCKLEQLGQTDSYTKHFELFFMFLRNQIECIEGMRRSIDTNFDL